MSLDNPDKYVLFNRPSVQYQVLLADPGEHTIYTRITYTDSTSYSSQSKIWVEDTRRPSKVDGPNYVNHEYEIEATVAHSGATLEIHYGAGNKDKRLKKPLIVAKLMSFEEYLETEEKDVMNLNNILTKPDFNEKFELLDNYLFYDIIFINFNNGMDDILRNAKLFQE